MTNKSDSNKKTDHLDTISVRKYTYQLNIIDSNIVNNSSKNIDVLYDGIRPDTLSRENEMNWMQSRAFFKTECLWCESVLMTDSSLIFANRLEILPDWINYYTEDIKITNEDTCVAIKYRDQSKYEFEFSEGSGVFKFVSVSCNDANYNVLELNYGNERVIIHDLLNGIFLEADLDNNQQKEQYIFGVRNCSQELIIYRIN